MAGRRGSARFRHGIRVRTFVWLGLTTPEWRRSRVAIVVRPSRSATAIRPASTTPRGCAGQRTAQSARRFAPSRLRRAVRRRARRRRSTYTARLRRPARAGGPVTSQSRRARAGGDQRAGTRLEQVAAALMIGGCADRPRRAARRCRPAGSATEFFGERLLGFGSSATRGGLPDQRRSRGAVCSGCARPARAPRARQRSATGARLPPARSAANSSGSFMVIIAFG